MKLTQGEKVIVEEFQLCCDGNCIFKKIRLSSNSFTKFLKIIQIETRLDRLLIRRFLFQP